MVVHYTLNGFIGNAVISVNDKITERNYIFSVSYRVFWGNVRDTSDCFTDDF